MIFKNVKIWLFSGWYPWWVEWLDSLEPLCLHHWCLWWEGAPQDPGVRHAGQSVWRGVPGRTHWNWDMSAGWVSFSSLLSSYKAFHEILLAASLYSGLIIAGGAGSNKAEVFVPSTGQHCDLPALTGWRFVFTMEKMTICGGQNTASTCETLTEGTWQTTTAALIRLE